MKKKTAGQRIQELRKMGYHIKVKQSRRGTVGYAPFGLFTRHEIRELRAKGDSIRAHPRGGQTEVTITDDLHGLVATGVARCRTDDPERTTPGDRFVNNIGLTIALNRALLELNLQKTIKFIKPNESDENGTLARAEALERVEGAIKDGKVHDEHGKVIGAQG